MSGPEPERTEGNRRGAAHDEPIVTPPPPHRTRIAWRRLERALLYAAVFLLATLLAVEYYTPEIARSWWVLLFIPPIYVVFYVVYKDS